MQHKVLARKMRPQDFSSLVGQEHIKKALSNAIANNRLHHAYLFTGTRGVGKTSLARILVKCLNCETGITNTPCNECNTCLEISAGSYPDLLEIDAASRTKVEDTREILDQVQYAPIKGRFKIFLIDEVHMLSGHSFNALLKTLEEPPEHVKFLLATTDPQKLPITVLSRCLQFNLQPIPKPQIIEHLGRILDEENISYEKPALDILASAAEGSLRDALSITDQAISFCDNNLTSEAVANILGISPRKYLEALLRGVIENQPKLVFETLAQLEIEGADFSEVLKEIAILFHALSYAQFLPEAISDKSLDFEILQELAKKASPEEIQLYYQFCIEGKRDLPLAPNYKCGVEMTFMRMLAFKPIDKKLVKQTPKTNIENSLTNEEEKKNQLALNQTNQTNTPKDFKQITEPPPRVFSQSAEYDNANANEFLQEYENYMQSATNSDESEEELNDLADSVNLFEGDLNLKSNSDWIKIYTQYLNLNKMLKVLLGDICFASAKSNIFQFKVLSSTKAFITKEQIVEFGRALSKLLKIEQEKLQIDFIEVDQQKDETPLQYKQRIKVQERQAQIAEIMTHKAVQDIIKLFEAQIQN